MVLSPLNLNLEKCFEITRIQGIGLDADLLVYSTMGRAHLEEFISTETLVWLLMRYWTYWINDSECPWNNWLYKTVIKLDPNLGMLDHQVHIDKIHSIQTEIYQRDGNYVLAPNGLKYSVFWTFNLFGENVWMLRYFKSMQNKIHIEIE